MTTTIALFTLFFLFLKHFIVDFPLQFPWNYLNKGTYGHPGGIMHSLGHFLGTAAVLDITSTIFGGLWSTDQIFWLCSLDGIVHYHVDWAKVKINKHYGWGPTTSEKFWILLGLDQFLHATTYIVILLLLIP